VSDKLIAGLHALGALQFGDFTLKSGAWSPVYMDLRLLVSDPALLTAAANAYLPLLDRLEFDRIAAVPYAALPIGTAVAIQSGRPLIYPRREAKSYGTGRTIEGLHFPGETAVVLDDVISSGASKLEAIVPLEAAGLKVRDVVVLIDRQAGGASDLDRAGYKLHAAYTLAQIVDCLAAESLIGTDQATAVRDYLSPVQ